MSFPTKKQVNVAVSNRNKFDLTRTHITTEDFGRIKPLECRYMVPGDTFNYKISSFTRLLPMYSPTFGKIDHIQRAFFVPMRTIFPYFDEFLRDRPVPMGRNNFVPAPFHCSLNTFIKSILSTSGQGQPDALDTTLVTFVHDIVVGEETPPSSGEYDFIIDRTLWTGFAPGFYKWTAKGRRLYDFLVSLGLNISFGNRYQSEDISLLPLLAFWKAYYDWIVPSRFVQSDESNIYHLLNIIRSQSEFTATQDQVKFYLLKIPLSYFKDDYFTSTWKKQFEADEEPAYGTDIPNPISGMSVVSDSPVSLSGGDETNGAYISYGQGPVDINQYSIESLAKLQDYLNRGMLAGSKIQDWLAVEFGMRPNTDAIGLSTYLGKAEDTIKIGDVLATADTQQGERGVPLGAYAGQAKGANVAQFSYSAKGEDHGFIIIFSELIPETSYYQGLIPEFQMIDRLDFFQPEFDNMGVEPVMLKDMFCSPVKYKYTAPGNPFIPDPVATQVFGYAPQYAKLKTAFNTISGDFRSRFGELLKTWYLARDLEGWIRYNYHDLFINDNFCKVQSDYQNWDDIFVGDDKTLDHFYSIYLIENSAQRPMLSVAEALNPEHPNGSKSVTVNTNGGID